MLFAFALLSFVTTKSTAQENKAFTRLGIATVHPLATDAGIQAVQSGGNAIDAAIAAALTLGVVDGHNSGIGGGCFIVIHSADGRITAIDGRETAPAKAHRDMYIINGKLEEKASKTGALASGVPGALAAYEVALKKYGKKKLADLLLPAAQIAEEGFSINEFYSRRLASVTHDLKKFDASAKILLKPDGTPWKKGEKPLQKDLAKTYRAIAEYGIDWFYKGDFAKKTAEWMQAHGGIMAQEDFASYKVVEREPIRTRYRDVELVTMPPPSSGGVHVAQILNIMDRFPLRHFRDASRIHVITEAMRLAFADRSYWLGDPDFTKVPRGLISPEYGASLASKIQLDTRSEIPSHHHPPRWENDIFGKHTTHLSAADAEGNWVAITQTINTGFGSKVIIPDTGVIMNNEMDDFSIQPGVPNAFKLIGAEANAIAPGKRPLSSMSPTLVLQNGKPFLSVGAAGGPTIITQTLLAISRIVDDGMTSKEALAAPRFHHQWTPEELKIENTWDKTTLSELQELGHQLDISAPFGACQAVMWDENTKVFLPSHDPRVQGKSSGL